MTSTECFRFISKFLVMDVYEEIQLFHGITTGQSGPLTRFVVAVPIYRTMMLLKVKVGDVVEHTRYGSASSRQIKFQPKLHGCTRRQVKLKVATISLKVTLSCIGWL